MTYITPPPSEAQPDTPQDTGPTVLDWQTMQELPPLEFLIDNLLPQPGISILVGHPKAGKSTLARALIAATLGVSSIGEPRFLGRTVKNTGPVVLYAPDEAPQMAVEHFRGILPKHTTGLHFVASRANLPQLADIVEATAARLLVVDTLGRLFQNHSFPDGDSYMAWQEHLDHIRSFAQNHDCHACLLHHARKSGGDRSLAVLGSSAIAGAVDSVIEVSTEEDKTNPGQWIRFVSSAQRAGIDLPKQKLVLQGDGWIDTQEITPDPQQIAIDEAKSLRKEGRHINDIAAQLGVNPRTIYRWVTS